MNQDVNKIIDVVGAEWANDAITLRKRLAILQEENARLKLENEQLKEELEAKEELKNETGNSKKE